MVGVTERPVAVRARIHTDTGKRVPLAEEDLIGRVPFRIGHVEYRGAGQLRREKPDDGRCSNRCEPCAPWCRREHERGEQGEGGSGQDRARSTKAIEQRDEHETAAGGSDQICRVHGIDARREPRDRERDDEAAGEERQRSHRIDDEHQHEVARRVIEPHPQPDQHEQRHDGARGVDRRLPHEEEARRVAIEPTPAHVRKNAARAQAEEGDRDRQKREVVVHHHGEDARQRQFGHEQRCRYERNADQVATRGRLVGDHAESVAFGL